MAFLGWVIWQSFVVCGYVGYGRFAARILNLRGLRNRLGSEVILGMLAVAAIAGTLSLTPLRGAGVWTTIVVVGVVKLGYDAVRSIRGRGTSLLNAAFFTSVGGLALYSVLAVEATLRREWQTCDDLGAYLYLARRSWQIGDLLDPFNNRRLTSFGTGSFFQGFSMGPMGDSTLHSFDEVIGAVLLASFAVSALRARERAWMFLLPIPLLLNQSAFGLTNSSPTFAIFAILLVALTEVISCLGESQPEKIATTRFIMFAFVLLTLLRPTAGVVLLPVIGCLVLVEIDHRRSLFDRWVVLGLAASFLPWSLLQWRDSGTPFFPVFAGYSSEIFPINGYSDRVAIGPHVVASLGQLGNSNFPILLVLGGFAAVGIGYVAGTRIIRRPWVTYLVIAVSAIVVYLGIAVVFRRHGLPLYPLLKRFTAPVFVAAGLAPIFALSQAGTMAEARPALRRLGQLASVLIVAFVSLSTLVTTIRDTPGRIIGDKIAQSLSADRFTDKESDYSQVRDRIPAGSKVLSAVDLPHLLLGGDFSMETYDIPGSMAPRGEFPVDGDLQEQRRWLEAQGVDYLVVQRTGTSSCLYSASLWSRSTNANYVASDYVPFVLSWIRFTDALQREPGLSERYGNIVVIPVTRAQPTA